MWWIGWRRSTVVDFTIGLASPYRFECSISVTSFDVTFYLNLESNLTPLHHDMHGNENGDLYMIDMTFAVNTLNRNISLLCETGDSSSLVLHLAIIFIAK
mmetsp:Transcript_40625/g.85036  ORF Transcript_40625/g.85036 Transcript_40625/m.85036 type:complete len:100 (+) Transcript_40625:1175-1474(+)